MRAMTTANHLIISQHMHFHGKNVVNVFLLITTLLNVYIPKWGLMSIYIHEQGCIKENPASCLSMETIHEIPDTVKLLDKGEKRI